MARNHYIPRFLTKPWETSNRILNFYNFDSKKIESEPSARLFAREDVYSDRLEKYFSRKLEGIFASQLDKLAEDVAIRDPKVYQAVQFVFWLQGARIRQALGTNINDLERHVDFSESDLWFLARSFDEEGNLRRFNIKPELRLFFPSSGHFPLLIPRPRGEYRIAQGLAITPSMAFVFAPKDVSDDELRLYMPNEAIVGASIGLRSYATKVLIPPEVLAQYTPDHLCNHIEESRANNHLIFELAGKGARIAEELREMLGEL